MFLQFENLYIPHILIIMDQFFTNNQEIVNIIVMDDQIIYSCTFSWASNKWNIFSIRESVTIATQTFKC